MANVLIVPSLSSILFSNEEAGSSLITHLSSSVGLEYDGLGGVSIKNFSSKEYEKARFNVEGHNGLLFTVSDTLTGQLLRVNDPSGLPIFVVNSSRNVEINDNLNVSNLITSLSAYSDDFRGMTAMFTNLVATSANIYNLQVQNKSTISGTISGNNLRTSFNQGNSIGNYSFAVNQGTAQGEYSNAQGGKTAARGNYSHSEGFETVAIGTASHSEGYKSTAAHDNTFIWSGDSTLIDNVSTTRSGQFMIHAPNGVYIPMGRVGIGTDNSENELTIVGQAVVDNISAANTFTRHLSVGSVLFRTLSVSNVFIGDSTTGNDITTGCHNFAVGLNAGNALTTGGNNNFFGNDAGSSNTTGQRNNFLGKFAGRSNTCGTSNNFIGYLAGCNNTSGSNNNFLGNRTGYYNISGSNNNFIGFIAGSSNTYGSNNNFIGYRAGLCNTLGNSNNFFGGNAGCNNTSGNNNNFLGNRAGWCNTSGNNNNFIGYLAGLCNTIGSNNNFFGYHTGFYNTSGSNNNFLGCRAGCCNTSGNNNNFIGFHAGYRNTIGCNNNFLGNRPGLYSTTGSNNNFLGDRAGLCNTSGSDNNFIGDRAGCSNTSGNNNNFLGHRAAYTNTVGSNNIIIGNNANVSTNSLSGVIVLGSGAIATESYQVVLSTVNVSFRNIGNTFEIGTPSLTDNLTVFGALSSTGIVNTNTGFRISNGATSGHVLRGNGTNFVSSTLAASDIASGQALTKTDDTNVTLSLGGTPSTSLLKSVSLSAGWAGQLAYSRGGTNANTAQGAINNLAGAVTSGQYLRGDGSNVIMSPISASDVPILNQNTTGSAATLTTSRTIAISGDLSYTSPPFNGSVNVGAIGTLATVNSNVGSFTNASVTVNAKGLVTAASNGTAPVTTVTGTSPVVSSGGTTPAISLAAGYGDTQNPYASKAQKTFLAAPNAVNGVPTFRVIATTDVPTLNQNTTGSAATLATTRTLWGQNFNGSTDVSGNLSDVGNIIGSGAITLSAAHNQDITLQATGTGEVNIPKVDIDSGTIDGVTIGGTAAATSISTNLLNVDNIRVDGNTISSTNTNGNIALQPNGSGITTISGNLSASGTVAAPTLSASDNLFVGDVLVRTRSTNNVFIGDTTTGSSVASGSNNFVFGTNGSGMFLTSGDNNVFLGDSVGRDNTTGSANNFLGRNAGNRNTTGIGNNFIGDLAGTANTTGNSNNIFGNSAGQSNTTGSSNNFLGTAAGLANTTGNFNIFLGRYTGISNQSGSNNTIMGNSADVATDSLSGVIVLGTNAVATASNQLAMGSSTWPLSATVEAGAAAGFLVINLNGTLRKIPFHSI